MNIQLSILCPVLNERNYIDTLIETFFFNDGIDKEVFFIDGGSSDGTKERILELKKEYKNLYLIDNPQRYVSFGFNKTFSQTQGKYIAFLGAHAIYPKDYFTNALQYLEKNECDAIGGPLKQIGRNSTGEAIAYCMSSKFGVGDTSFRTSSKKQFVESVAFAIYKRTVFEKAGLMDEQLLRNQDDEFHYRMNEYGFRILMIPEMQTKYVVRDNITKLFSQYFQYGLFKPLVLKKVKSGIRLRHLIPAGFVIYLLSFPLILATVIWSIPFVLYISMNFLFSFNNNLKWSQKLLCLIIFPALHVSYGCGFIVGLIIRKR